MDCSDVLGVVVRDRIEPGIQGIDPFDVEDGLGVVTCGKVNAGCMADAHLGGRLVICLTF